MLPDEFRKILDLREETQHRGVLDPDVTFQSLGEKVPGLIRTSEGDSFTLTDGAFSNLCEILGAPCRYLMRCPPDLREANVNTWVRTEIEGKRPLDGWGFYSQESVIQTFSRLNFVHTSSRSVFDMLMEVVDGGMLDVLDTYVTSGGVEFKIVTSREIEARVGDITRAGLSIRHSDRELLPFSVEPFMYRLVCVNGVVVPECTGLRRYRSGDEGDALGKMREHVSEVYSSLQDQMSAYADKINRPVEDRDSVLNTIFRERYIPQAIRSLVRDSWEQDPGDTEYHLLNAFSRAANSESVSGAWRRQLQRVAGTLAADPLHRCPRCYHAVM